MTDGVDRARTGGGDRRGVGHANEAAPDRARTGDGDGRGVGHANEAAADRAGAAGDRHGVGSANGANGVADSVSLLEVEGVTVTFGGHVALDEVSLGIDAGMVTGLIGPNGAGKTTLVNAITGMVAARAGTVRLAGDDISGLTTHQRARAGLGRTFQRMELFGSLTVRENVRVAADIRNRWTWRRRGRRDVNAEADRVIEMLGLAAVADQLAGVIPTGRARLVELARALMIRPRALLLDEPAAGQDDADTDAFVGILADLAAEGMAVLLVEHDMGLVMRACQRIHVLDLGALIASGSPTEVQRDPAVVSAYLGPGAAA